MPKTPSILLKNELIKYGYELLDVYRYRDRDLVRLLDKHSGKVIIYESKKHIDELNTADEIKSIVSEIINYVKGKRS